jgi:hypothetical protein
LRVARYSGGGVGITEFAGVAGADTHGGEVPKSKVVVDALEIVRGCIPHGSAEDEVNALTGRSSCLVPVHASG